MAEIPYLHKDDGRRQEANTVCWDYGANSSWERRHVLVETINGIKHASNGVSDGRFPDELHADGGYFLRR